MRHRIPITIVVLSLLVLVASCAGPPPPSPDEVRVVVRDEIPLRPDDPSWSAAPAHPAELLLQDLVEPRLLEVSTPSVTVRAVTDGTRIAFKLEWDDATPNDLPGASRFVDACAVQLPRDVAADVPAPQMGERDRPVEITYWRASWQATVDGRQDTIQALYPGATVDHYPFQAPSLEPGSDEQRGLELAYAPARALEHGMEGPRDRPVEDLLAEGPGTITPAARQDSEGAGRRTSNGWEVVIVRSLPSGLTSGGKSQVAFAVWDGARDESGARKMRSGWIPIRIGGEA